MPMWLIVLLLSSGVPALGALAQLIASWREGHEKPSPGGAVMLLGARICLVCWSFVLLVRGVDWLVGGLFERLPQPVSAVLDGFANLSIFVAAAAIVIAAIGGTAWLIRD